MPVSVMKSFAPGLSMPAIVRRSARIDAGSAFAAVAGLLLAARRSGGCEGEVPMS
nr:hypothetical protein [Paraburkholderia sp. BL8N3]